MALPERPSTDSICTHWKVDAMKQSGADCSKGGNRKKPAHSAKGHSEPAASSVEGYTSTADQDSIIKAPTTVVLTVIMNLEPKVYAAEKKTGLALLLTAFHHPSGETSAASSPGSLSQQLFTTPQIMELPYYHDPWREPKPWDSVKDDDTVSRSYILNPAATDSACGPANVLLAVTKNPATRPWSCLTRNQVLNQMLLTVEDDKEFQNNYAVVCQKDVEPAACRRIRRLMLSNKYIKMLVDGVKAAICPMNLGSSGAVPNEVFNAISEAFAFRADANPEGIIRQLYSKVISVPSTTVDFQETTQRAPTATACLDSCWRMMCKHKQCYRYGCQEHLWVDSGRGILKVFPVCKPKTAKKACGEKCYTKIVVVAEDNTTHRCPPEPLTSDSKGIVKTLLTDGNEEDVPTVCDLAIWINRSCWEAGVLVAEFLRSAEGQLHEDSGDMEEIETTSPIRSNTSKRHKSKKQLCQLTDAQYKPCTHLDDKNRCNESYICACFRRGTYCESPCTCGVSCTNRFAGCACVVTNCRTSACRCYAANRECDPEVCRCPAKLPKANCCSNTPMLFNTKLSIKCGRSAVHGWGAFLMHSAKKGEFISEYLGEVIDNNEVDRREPTCEKNGVSYVFVLNKDLNIDGVNKGNKIRYANDSGSQPANCAARNVRVQGIIRIEIYATQNIAAGDELFLDYNYDLEHKKNFRDYAANDLQSRGHEKSLDADESKTVVEPSDEASMKITPKAKSAIGNMRLEFEHNEKDGDKEAMEEKILSDFQLAKATILTANIGEEVANPNQTSSLPGGIILPAGISDELSKLFRDIAALVEKAVPVTIPQKSQSSQSAQTKSRRK